MIKSSELSDINYAKLCFHEFVFLHYTMSMVCLMHFDGVALPPCRCGVCDPAGGQSDQAQFGSDLGRPRDSLHEDSEHLQNH